MENEQVRELVLALAELEAVAIGRFKLASGTMSPIYIDLRLLVSNPSLLGRIASAYAELLAPLACDRIAAVPYAALPIGTALSLQTDIPLIYARKEVKEYGTGRSIEGRWEAGERVVVIEDLITSGGSILKSVDDLRGAGLIVEDALVLIDREQGGVQALAEKGIRVHSVLGIGRMLDILLQAERISHPKYVEVQHFLSNQ